MATKKQRHNFIFIQIRHLLYISQLARRKNIHMYNVHIERSTKVPIFSRAWDIFR
jgi:hypothetical protein